MNKNRLMAILIAVTAVCMIIGTLYHILGVIRFRTGSETGTSVEMIVEEWTDGNKEEKALTESGDQPETEENETEAEAEEETEDAAETGEDVKESSIQEDASVLKKIHADVDIAELTICSGEGLHVEYKGDEDFEPEVIQKNGILTVTQHVDSRWFDFFKVNNKNGIKITVTVPEGTKLTELTTDLDLGDTRLRDLEAEKCNISNDLGDIKCEDCVFTDVLIRSSLGDVDVEDCDFTELEVQQDMGDVDISTKQDLSDADLVLETDLGDLSINGEDQGRKHSRSGNGEIRVVVRNDLGDIDLDYPA